MANKEASVAELTEQVPELERRSADRVPRPHRCAAQEAARVISEHANYAVVKNTLTKIAANDGRHQLVRRRARRPLRDRIRAR